METTIQSMPLPDLEKLTDNSAKSEEKPQLRVDLSIVDIPAEKVTNPVIIKPIDNENQETDQTELINTVKTLEPDNQLSEKVAYLQNELATTKQELEKFVNLSKDLATLQKEITSLKTLPNKLEKLQQEIGEVQILQEAQLSRLNDQEKQIKQLQKEKADLQKLAAKITEYEQEMSSLKNANLQLVQEVKQLEDESDNAKAKSQNLALPHKQTKPEIPNKAVPQKSNKSETPGKSEMVKHYHRPFEQRPSRRPDLPVASHQSENVDQGGEMWLLD